VNFNQLMANLRFQFSQHGWPALAGLLLLAGAVVVHWLGVIPARTHTGDLRLQQSEMRKRASQQPSAGADSSKRTHEFYSSLPAPSGALDAIEVIHRLAAAKGVKLATGDYRLVREGNTQLQRYQITLPARARYPNLRAWIADVMNALPSAALEEVSFGRDDVSKDSVDARIRFTLFLRGS
jgi:hypothetical protein